MIRLLKVAAKANSMNETQLGNVAIINDVNWEQDLNQFLFC